MPTIRDALKFGDVSELKNKIVSDVSNIEAFMNRFKEKHKRNTKNVVLFNILRKAITYMECLKLGIDGPTEQLAFSTRSLFELNLITRYVLKSEENLDRFVYQSAVNKRETYEGILTLSDDPSNPNAKDIRKEIERIDGLLKGKDARKLPSTKDMAKGLDALDEYIGLFKLYCNYVHPSSYTINAGSEEVHSPYIRNVFLIKSQQYCADTFERIKSLLSPPSAG